MRIALSAVVHRVRLLLLLLLLLRLSLSRLMMCMRMARSQHAWWTGCIHLQHRHITTHLSTLCRFQSECLHGAGIACR